MHDLIDSTSETISTLLEAPVSLRQLAVRLYGDVNRVGLLADVRARRYAHISHANIHDLRRRLGLSYDVRHIIDVPSDHDAAVHILPAGNGTLHTYTVPADAEVVIVPAGTRVVQSAPASKPPSKPRQKRIRLDVTHWELLGLSRDEMREVLDAAAAEKRALREQMEMDYHGDPARILRLVDDWLAEDASIDPIVVSAEVAAVLARLE